jgi:hypothetical protein
MKAKVEQDAVGGARHDRAGNTSLATCRVRELDFELHINGFASSPHVVKTCGQGVYAREKTTQFGKRGIPAYDRCCIADPQVHIVSDDLAPRYGVESRAGYQVLEFCRRRLLKPTGIQRHAVCEKRASLPAVTRPCSGVRESR